MSEPEMKGTVWLVETIDWPESTYFVGAFASLDAAIASIKKPYGPPYIVEWGPVKETQSEFVLSGKFERVPDYSAAHTAEFRIWEEPIRTEPPKKPRSTE